AARIVFLYQVYTLSLLLAQAGAFQRRIPTLRSEFTLLASAASWKLGSRWTLATSLARRMVAASGPVELLRSLPISILTCVMIGRAPPKRICSNCRYWSGCSDL